MSYTQLTEELALNAEETISWRRYLHQHPEPSFKEFNTRKYIAEKLKDFGYDEIETEVGGGGVTAYVRGDESGPTIGFRADFDALYIQEETGLEFASKNPGVMHACGHDAHTAILLSVAKVLKAHQSELKGTIKFLFQHAEEVLPGGAKSMIEDGVLEDVDYVYGLHVASPAEFGKIYYCSGYALASPDVFEIKIQGKGGHAAHPNSTIDSVVVGSYVVEQLQSIISRNKDPKEAGVLTVSTFKAGDGANNVISDTAYLKGTVRTLTPEARDLIEERIKELTKKISEAHGATAEVNYVRGYPSLYNHPEETNLIKNIFIEKFGEETIEETEPRMPGEDFSYFMLEKPGSFFNVTSGNAEKGITYPHHHPKFDLDERVLLVGGKAFLAIVDHYLVDKETASERERTSIK